MLTAISETASAKVNLTLKVLGRRADGYHELSSLVAFASVGDVISLDPTRPVGLTVSGPFAADIRGANILDTACSLLSERAPHLRIGAIHLEKRLPVAAGLGGGSANAAALLRALRRANADDADAVDWFGLARQLGADVPVCLFGQACWMSGIGHDIMPLETVLPGLDVVLVNPMAEVPLDKTARVFRALGAPVFDKAHGFTAPGLRDREALLAVMRKCGNDLAAPAEAVVPEMGDVLAVLLGLEGTELASVSGAGPTCFAVMSDGTAALAAAEQLRAARPEWWVTSAQIG